jgi:HEPN domain-containing protein
MPDLEHAQELLAVVDRELRAMRAMLSPATFADEVFGLLAQQATEKALKAWLCALGEEYPFTHDLSRLVRQLADGGQEVSDLWPLADLNPYAVERRYSTGLADDVPLDRDDAIRRVEALRRHVGDLLGGASEV